MFDLSQKSSSFCYLQIRNSSEFFLGFLDFSIFWDSELFHSPVRCDTFLVRFFSRFSWHKTSFNPFTKFVCRQTDRKQVKENRRIFHREKNSMQTILRPRIQPFWTISSSAELWRFSDASFPFESQSEKFVTAQNSCWTPLPHTHTHTHTHTQYTPSLFADKVYGISRRGVPLIPRIPVFSETPIHSVTPSPRKNAWNLTIFHFRNAWLNIPSYPHPSVRVTGLMERPSPVAENIVQNHQTHPKSCKISKAKESNTPCSPR
jgi:hypothetical protein